MTMKKIIDKINHIIGDAEDEAFNTRIDGYGRDSYGSPIYQDGYGYASFPIRLSQKQATEVAEYLSNKGFDYWICDEVRINKSATYELWVSVQASVMSDISPETYWGFRRVTVSPDEIYETVTRRGRRV